MAQLQDFFFWCMVINIGIYMLVIIAWLAMRDFYTSMLMKTLGLNEETVRKGVFQYTANYKLLITVFNFTPWLAMVLLHQS